MSFDDFDGENPDSEPLEFGDSAVCDVVKQHVRQLTQKIREDYDMINRGKPEAAGRGKQRGARKQSGLDFLTVDHLSFNKEHATILAARVQDDTFKPGQQVVAVKVLFKTNPYLWNLRSTNPNLDILCDGLGEDESKWANTDILVFKERDDFDNKEWMRCEVPVAVKDDEPAKGRRK